jgi:hypothetical protein
MKVKYYPILLVLFLLISCQEPSPSFDPFDPIFDVDMDVLQKDSTLKLIGDCMAFTYLKNYGAYETYYSLYTYSDREDSIVGKGMNIFLGRKGMTRNIDPTLSVQDSLVIVQQNEVVDSIKRIPIDTAKIDSILGLFYLTRKEEFMKVRKGIGWKEYFIVCVDTVGTEYLFENKFKHTWLSNGKVLGKRYLNFDTRISRNELFYEMYD